MSLFVPPQKSSSEEPMVSPTSTTNFGNLESRIEKSIQRRLHEDRTTFPVKIAWIFVLIAMASFFMSAAYVQHNDPDSCVWMPVYLIPGFINLILAFFSCYPHTASSSTFWSIMNWIITIHICYCYALGFWTLTHFLHRQFWSNESGTHVLAEMVSEPGMHAEEAKELIGICLVVIWLSFLNDGNYLRFGKMGVAFGALLTALPVIAWLIVESLENNLVHACF